MKRRRISTQTLSARMHDSKNPQVTNMNSWQNSQVSLCVPQVISQENWKRDEHDEDHEDLHPNFSRKIQIVQK